MLSLIITRITKQEMPLFGMMTESEESIKRSHMMSQDDEYDSKYENPIKY